MKKRIASFGFMLMVVAGSALAQTPWFKYDANATTPPLSPTTQAWAEGVGSEGRQYSAALSNDKGSGYNAWQIGVTNPMTSNRRLYYFTNSFPNSVRSAILANGFTARWRLRIPNVVGVADRSVSLDLTAGSVNGNPPYRRFVVRMGRINSPSRFTAQVTDAVGSTLTANVPMSGTDDYQMWTLIYDGVNHGDTARLFVDWHKVTNWTARADASTRFLQFGADNPAQAQTGNWNLVEFYTNVLADPVQPPPPSAYVYDANLHTPPDSPLLQGWTNMGTIAGIAITDDLGSSFNAWKIGDNSASARLNYRLDYESRLGPLMLANGFGARWRMRLPGNAADNRTAEVNIEAGRGDPGNTLRWTMTHLRSGNNLTLKFYTGSQYLTRTRNIGNPEAFHVWTFNFDGTNTPNHVTSIYLDYDLMLAVTNFARWDRSKDFYFGSVDDTNVGTSHWNLVEIQTMEKFPVPALPTGTLIVIR